MNRKATVFVIGINGLQQFNPDPVGALRIEKKAARFEQLVRVTDKQDLDRRAAEPGYFESALVQAADATLPSAGTLRKNDQVAAVCQMPGHGRHALQHQVCQVAGGIRGQVSGQGQHIAVERNRKQARLGNGGMSAIKRNQQDRIKIRNMIADHHARSNIPDSFINFPPAGRYEYAYQGEENPVKKTVQVLKTPIRLLGKQVCQ